jgi:hypothetical protein
MSQSSAATEFRISPRFRWLCFGSILFSLGAIALLGWYAWKKDGVDAPTFLGIVFFALITAVPTLTLEWRLRIDRHGVTTYLLGPIDSWTWDDFASGRIQKIGATLMDPARPRFRRGLNLERLTDDDRRRVLCAINAFYELPAAPELPESLTFRLGLGRLATLNRHGIQIRDRRTTKDYAWSDVQRICIMREDPIRRDFRFLDIVLPDQEIELGLGTGSAQSMAKRERISEFLCRYAPAERTETGVDGKESKSRLYLERKAKEARQNMRTFLIGSCVYTPIFLGTMAFFMVGDTHVVGFGEVLGMAEIAAMAIIPLGILICAFAIKRRVFKELKHQLGSLAIRNVEPNSKPG